ncbi:hypothetical protein Tco_1013774 [Tanacetum coccineum]
MVFSIALVAIGLELSHRVRYDSRLCIVVKPRMECHVILVTPSQATIEKFLSNVGVGALEVVEGAPDVDEGRLEKDVHGMRGALGEQREVLDSMASNFSRFTTWTVTGLSRMMDQAGFRYTSFSDYHIPYVRRTVHRTDDASTSARQQPDP